MMLCQIIVTIPGLSGAGPNLDEAHAPLQQSAGDEDLPRLRAGAVEIENMLWLLCNIKGVRSIGLHAIGHFEGLDAGLELRFMLALLQMLLIQCKQKIKLTPLLLGRGEVALDV